MSSICYWMGPGAGGGGAHKFYPEWESRLRGKVLPKFSKANLSSLRACMLACRSSKRLLLGYQNRSGGWIGQPLYNFQQVSLEFTMHARCKRF